MKSRIEILNQIESIEKIKFDDDIVRLKYQDIYMSALKWVLSNNK